MKISILTLFPKMFVGPFDHSIIKNARNKGIVEINFVDIRDFGEGKHKIVDDTEYGGGIGMVLKVDVLYKALLSVKNIGEKEKIILLSATGSTYSQKMAVSFSRLDHLVIICGHYEGVDERIKQFIDEEVSIGDFVLTGGEIPAMLIVDSLTRHIPGVLPVGAAADESFSDKDGEILLEYPHYTKPREYEGEKVPEVLLSGNHLDIKNWRKTEAVNVTKKRRPDLLKNRHR